MKNECLCLDNPVPNDSREYATQLMAVDITVDIFSTIQARLAGLPMPTEKDSDYRVILRASVPKTLNTLHSVVHLCNRTLTQDARTLVRKMLEHMINLLYLNLRLDERDKMAKQVLTHGAIRNHNYAQWISKTPNLFSEVLRDWFAKHRDELDAAYEDAKDVFPLDDKGEIERKYSEKWSGKSLREMMIGVKLESELTSYEVFCGSTHFGTADIVTHFDLQGGCVLEARDIEEIPILLTKSCQIAGQIAELIDHKFQCGIEAKLGKLMGVLKSSQLA